MVTILLWAVAIFAIPAVIGVAWWLSRKKPQHPPEATAMETDTSWSSVPVFLFIKPPSFITIQVQPP